MFFDTETIGTPGCKCSESTQAIEGWQWVTGRGNPRRQAVDPSNATTCPNQ
jgi:hypothetical protein